MTLIEAIKAAEKADDDFSAAVKAAGLKSRWDARSFVAGTPLADAYFAKIQADADMHFAFEQSRKSRN